MQNSTKEAPKRAKVEYPPYWRKKKLNPKFVRELEETVEREPAMEDEFGSYKEGIFLHGCSFVVVSITDGLWSLEIHSDNPIHLPLIQEMRYKFIPDVFLMALILPPRDKRLRGNVAVLYQVPGTMEEKK